jgi:hypothetical protein
VNGPPATGLASTNTGVSPAPTPELREIQIRDCDNQFVRKATRAQADKIVTDGIGDWHTATNGRDHVKLKTISAGRHAGDWMRPTDIVRERLQRNAPGRELTPMYRFMDS